LGKNENECFPEEDERIKMIAEILKNQEKPLQIKEKRDIVYYSNIISCRRRRVGCETCSLFLEKNREKEV